MSQDIFETFEKMLNEYDGMMEKTMPMLEKLFESSNNKAFLAAILLRFIEVCKRMANFLIRDVEQLEAFLDRMEPVKTVEP